MKFRFLQFFLVFLFSSSLVVAQNTYVPDNNFEQRLIDLGYDSSLDDSVLTNNISSLTTLDISHKGISDLTGLQDFSNLETLICFHNSFTRLDTILSTLLFLKNLDCSFNSLISLDLSKNLLLSQLDAKYNQLQTLNLDNNHNLRIV